MPSRADRASRAPRRAARLRRHRQARVRSQRRSRQAPHTIGPERESPPRARSARPPPPRRSPRSEEHTSELQSLMRISYAVFCLKKKNTKHNNTLPTTNNTTQIKIRQRTEKHIDKHR